MSSTTPATPPSPVSFERVARCIRDVLDVPAEDIQPETPLDRLGADSIDRVEITIRMEEEFDMVITDEEVVRVRTAGELAELVARLAAESAATS